MMLLEKFAPIGTTNIGPACREIIIDAAKIAHICSLNSIRITDVDFTDVKIKLIRKAISLEPLRAELWLLFYEFIPEEHPMKAQAIFKAYELEPESEVVQSHLIKYYLKSRSNYQKAFRIIVRSY